MGDGPETNFPVVTCDVPGRAETKVVEVDAGGANSLVSGHVSHVFFVKLWSWIKRVNLAATQSSGQIELPVIAQTN